MIAHQTYLIEQFKQVSKNRETTSQRPEHLGTSRTLYGLRNGIRRDIIHTWVADHQDITFNDWVLLIDGLYHGVSYEERCTPPTLFTSYRHYRQQLPLRQLESWLGQLEGWAEVDSTCQSVFTAKEMLADWDGWRKLLEQLTNDNNINKRRASLVLLTSPITKSPDERLIQQALKHVDHLKHEKDKLITKAISWVLRKGIKQHRAHIESYLEQHSDTLPAIAVRETRRKLETGKK